jgi:hypothetical protein
LIAKRYSNPPNNRKQKAHHHHDKAEDDHILFGIPQIPDTDILLHHLLVQTGHGNRDEHPADDLLEEKVLAPDIVRMEDPGEPLSPPAPASLRQAESPKCCRI